MPPNADLLRRAKCTFTWTRVRPRTLAFLPNLSINQQCQVITLRDLFTFRTIIDEYASPSEYIGVPPRQESRGLPCQIFYDLLS